MSDSNSLHRVIRAPRDTQLSCKSWLTEAAYRMIQHNLDPEVAERPQDLVVYGGRGQAARNWAAFEVILDALRALEDDETLLVQSGKPVAVFRTHADAPRVLIAKYSVKVLLSARGYMRSMHSSGRWMVVFRKTVFSAMILLKGVTHAPVY